MEYSEARMVAGTLCIYIPSAVGEFHEAPVWDSERENEAFREDLGILKVGVPEYFPARIQAGDVDTVRCPWY